MSYERIKEAAQKRAEGESTGAWRLADALAAEVPERQHGQAVTSGNGSDVATILADIAVELERTEIETPAGAFYTVASLRELRLVALGWAKSDRYPEAAFRTHQEAGSSDEWRRGVLHALCEAAASGNYTYPEWAVVDEDAWAAAIIGVRRKVKAGSRYSVSANDLRLALRRKRNVPRPDPGNTVMDAIEELQEATEHARRATRILATEGQHIGDSHEALEGLRDAMREVLGWLDVLLTTGGVTDAALAELLEGEQSA